MREDEKGLDTVFGALILIMVCLTASSALIALDTSSGSESQDIHCLEMKFDCVLSSTLDLKYSVGGVEFDRQVSLAGYAIEMLGHGPGNAVPSVENASGGISPLIDFYFGGFSGWSLRLNDAPLDSIELASRGTIDLNRGSIYILSRSLIGRNGGEASLDLTICQ